MLRVTYLYADLWQARKDALMSKAMLCLDFDTVCHFEGLWKFLEDTSEHFEIYIYSSRSAHAEAIEAMIDWFVVQNDSPHIVGVGVGADYVTWITTDNNYTIHFPSHGISKEIT